MTSTSRILYNRRRNKLRRLRLQKERWKNH